MRSRLNRVSLAAVVALAAMATTTGQTPARGTRIELSDYPLPGVDRGLGHHAEPMRGVTHGFVPGRAGSAPYLRGSILVKFKAGADQAQRARALSTVRSAPVDATAFADFSVVVIPEDEDAERAAAILAARPDVEYAQARYRVREMFVPNDPLYGRQWNLSTLDMERAWDINPGAASEVIVAVVDSGMAYRNALIRYNAGAAPPFPALGLIDVPFSAAPDLGATGRIVAPRDFIWNNADPLDLDGHGTHVAGIIGELTNNGVGVAGMAFNVRLMPVKVIDGDWDIVFNSPSEATDDVVARGIRYAADNGAMVINMSLGRNGPPAPAVRSAIQYAVGRGAFVAVAAGNEFEDGNPANRIADFAPEIEGMVAVGAIGPTRQRAYYSNTGPYVELVAPGGDARRSGVNGAVLQQTYDQDFVDRFSAGVSRYGPPRFDIFAYEYFQGTSMAAPHVSGFAALLRQQGITSPAAIEAIMKQFATDLGPAGRDDEYGAGLINPRAALRGLGLIR